MIEQVIGPVVASILTSAITGYVASWRGTQRAIQDHGKRITVLETHDVDQDRRIERVEGKVFNGARP